MATKDLLDAVLNHYGVPLGQVQVSFVDPKNAADAVKAKQVDVLFAAGPSTGHAINDAIAAATLDGRAPSFIAIDQAEEINKRNSAFNSIDIDAGTFGGNPPTPDDSLTKSELRRISGGPKRVQPRCHFHVIQIDLFVTARARRSDAA